MSRGHSQGAPADQPLQLFGSNASPYSCKLRAILRYRHIAHQWRVCMPALAIRQWLTRLDDASGISGDWQEKCRQQILQRWQQLTPSQQGSLNETLRQAGCLEWLTTHSDAKDGR